MITEETDIYTAFRSLENPSVPLDPYLDDANPAKKIVVTDKTAKTFAPWWQGLTVISSAVAQLPLLTYQRLQPKGKQRANDHPTYRVLHRRTNQDIGPFAFKELMTMRCVSQGNAYAFIDRRGGDVDSLWPFPIGSITPVREGGTLAYAYIPETGQPEKMRADDVFHLKGPGDDTLEGLSLVGIARESVSTGLQAQRYTHKFLENDAKPGVVLEFPEAMDGPTAKNILRHWTARHGGSSNSNRPALLDRGGKVNPFSMSNLDSQFIEQREMSRAEVANWLNLPPHRVGDLTRSTFSNIEQQSIDFVTYSLMPWLMRWQDECNAKLFRTAEIINEEYFTEFLISALLRGDYNSRMDGHTKAQRMGLLSIDEIRDMENLNPLPDSQGESHYVTLDLTQIGQVVDDATETDSPVTEQEETERLHLLSKYTRAYQLIGKNCVRAAASNGRLQVYRDVSLVDDLQKMGDDMPAAEIEKDFQDLIAHALDATCQEETLRERIESSTRCLADTRPLELITERAI